jgi:hypothetical protein
MKYLSTRRLILMLSYPSNITLTLFSTEKMSETKSYSNLSQDTSGYVGFANLPNQVHRKSVKKGFEFTLMVAGEYFSQNTSICKLQPILNPVLWIDIVSMPIRNPTFHFDADSNPDPDPILNFTHFEKREICFCR